MFKFIVTTLLMICVSSCGIFGSKPVEPVRKVEEPTKADQSISTSVGISTDRANTAIGRILVLPQEFSEYEAAVRASNKTTIDSTEYHLVKSELVNTIITKVADKFKADKKDAVIVKDELVVINKQFDDLKKVLEVERKVSTEKIAKLEEDAKSSFVKWCNALSIICLFLVVGGVVAAYWQPKALGIAISGALGLCAAQGMSYSLPYLAIIGACSIIAIVAALAWHALHRKIKEALYTPVPEDVEPIVSKPKVKSSDISKFITTSTTTPAPTTTDLPPYRE